MRVVWRAGKKKREGQIENIGILYLGPIHSIHPDPPRGAPDPPLSAPTGSGSALIQTRASF